MQVPTPRAAEPGASPYLYSPAVSFSLALEEATCLLRGTLPDDPDGQRAALAQTVARPEVVGVFADPAIATCLVCPGDPAVGTDQADGGTSAACPVAAGVVAAVRERYPASVLSPAGLRALLAKTAEDLGGTGFDHDFGWGVLDGRALVAALAGVKRSRRR